MKRFTINVLDDKIDVTVEELIKPPKRPFEDNLDEKVTNFLLGFVPTDKSRYPMIIYTDKFNSNCTLY